jgi:hypothetical protein
MEPAVTVTAATSLARVGEFGRRALAALLVAVSNTAEVQTFAADRGSTLVSAGWRATSRLR